MTLHISEAEVRVLLTMPMAVDAVEEISRKQASGEVVLHPRRRFEFPGGNFFHYMAAADYTAGYLAMKQYTYVRGNLRFLVPLYEMATGELLALIEADYMGQLRTGAASGVATKYLARRDARVAAIIASKKRRKSGKRRMCEVNSMGLWDFSLSGFCLVAHNISRKRKRNLMEFGFDVSKFGFFDDFQ